MKIHDFVIIGSGIGCAGLLSKLEHMPDVIITRPDDKKIKFNNSILSDEYTIRRMYGNAHDWGGVLSIPCAQSFTKGIAFYRKALFNYFKFTGQNSLLATQTSELISGELTPYRVRDNIKLRKLLVSSSGLVKKNISKVAEQVKYKYAVVNRIEVGDDDIITIYCNNGKKIAKTKKIALCAGVISTMTILNNSNITEPITNVTDSVFGRIGRIRFDKPVPFGLFHQHLISKTIRFKTGYEVKENELASMFFLQPAIKGIPATDIQLIKKYISLKTNFKFKEFCKLFFNFKLLIQIFMLEASFRAKITDFDVYCISELGDCQFDYCEDNYLNLSPLIDLSSEIKANYKKFISFMSENDEYQVTCTDHELQTPLLKNLESAMHLSGTLKEENHVIYDTNNRIYRLKANPNIIINDNSIVNDKGVANPSLSLF